jgi:hypothetical protein
VRQFDDEDEPVGEHSDHASAASGKRQTVNGKRENKREKREKKEEEKEEKEKKEEAEKPDKRKKRSNPLPNEAARLASVISARA